MKRRRLALALLGLGSLTGLARCGGSAGGGAGIINPPPAAVFSMTITPSSATVPVAGTTHLAATPKDVMGHALQRTVTWSSARTATATVDPTGLVLGVAAGTVQISATSEGQSASATITVSPPPVATVTVTPPTVNMPVGATTQLAATTTDAGGATVTGRTIEWMSNAPGVATVSGTGLVTAVARGTATIYAISEGKMGGSVIEVF